MTVFVYSSMSFNLKARFRLTYQGVTGLRELH
jgi:hypothetical protein